MGVKGRDKFVKDLLTNLVKAADGSRKLDVSDPDEIGKYVFTVLGLACGLIPVVGSGITGLTTLMSGILFQSDSTDKIWLKLRERIEALVDSKIAENQIEILNRKIRGLQYNMQNYQRILQDFEDSSGQEKERSRETLKATHIAFLSVVRAAIPEFRVKQYALPSLPLFALAANIHLLLLSDGIKNGEAWGYSKRNIDTLRAEFREKAFNHEGLIQPASDIITEQSSMLKAAISTATNLEIPTELVDTWKSAHFDLVADTLATAGAANDYNDIDYTTYVNRIYLEGRTKVEPYRPERDLYEDQNKGAEDAAKLRAWADYDANMVMNVLSYAAYWPYLDGSKMPESALRAADREIFCGPFGRYTTHAAWSTTSPAPITARGPPITAAYLRASGNVDGVQMKYGDTWGRAWGSTTDGKPRQLDLAEDEYIYYVSVYYGHKLGKVRFWNNKEVAMENGDCENGSYWAGAAPAGYSLSSVYITKWEKYTPRGCEGIILGFRPQWFEFTPN